jgi:uncharacterized protein (TIGR02594 family)
MKTSVKNLQQLIVESGQNIAVDGIFGKQTSNAIDNMKVPNWLKTAMKEIGVHEILGVKHNHRILQYHEVSGGFSEDEVPWCASYVNWVMLQNGYNTVKYPARAKSWLNFGKSSIIPIVGSIAVKSRAGGGHVCFVLGANDIGELYCLGGNQNDEVNIKLYKKDVFIDFRVPTTFKNEYLPRYSVNLNGGEVKEA